MDVSIIIAGIAMIIISVISLLRSINDRNFDKRLLIIFFIIVGAILTILGVISTFFGGA